MEGQDVEKWRKLNEEGFFVKRHEEYLKNRIFEKGEEPFVLQRTELEEGIPAFVLFHRVGLARSNSAARRLIEQGGAYINTIRVEEDEVVTPKFILPGGEMILSSGKKNKKRIMVK